MFLLFNLLPIYQDNNPTEVIINSIDTYYNKLLISLPRIALAIFIIVAGILISKLITNFYKRRFLKQAEDPLMARFLAQTIKITLIAIAIIIALQVAGLNGIATGLLTAVGGGAIVLGFAFQDIGKNFLAGIILAFSRPFNVNDTIMIDSHFGKVRALNFRYTHIKTSDGRDIYIPNSDVLTKPVENYTADGFYRNEFVVGIGYEDDIAKVKAIIINILKNHDGVVQDEEHESFVIENELGPSTINLKVFFWVHTVDYRVSSRVLRGEVIKKVIEALIEAKFILPGNITEIKLYGGQEDLPLKLKKDPKDRILDLEERNLAEKKKS
ncbi:mechanosensitive ion channel-like protein [Lacinutrix venerupis]|uniref:Mechanosensitive ion channel protein MscS n=1 Tax=Lacinutrix venerupis TaxID=1486034 RepID=A0AAC9LKF0_9FLAO|nr:mechanosensitive ion channel family protein [Lacinutrix venerupis]APY00396.1 mechanosensitive ion channel protein MscS [Lacinutrix venerupis]RLJ68773.1 mechanosensitive ion channel-like protein [Lacinutrix venerupis]